MVICFYSNFQSTVDFNPVWKLSFNTMKNCKTCFWNSKMASWPTQNNWKKMGFKNNCFGSKDYFGFLLTSTLWWLSEQQNWSSLWLTILFFDWEGINYTGPIFLVKMYLSVFNSIIHIFIKIHIKLLFYPSTIASCILFKLNVVKNVGWIE